MTEIQTFKTKPSAIPPFFLVIWILIFVLVSDFELGASYFLGQAVSCRTALHD